MIVSRGGKFGADFVCAGLFSLTLFFLRNYTDRTGDWHRPAKLGLVDRQSFSSEYSCLSPIRHRR